MTLIYITMDIYRSNENLMSSYTGGLRLWSVLILGDTIKNYFSICTLSYFFKSLKLNLQLALCWDYYRDIVHF